MGVVVVVVAAAAVVVVVVVAVVVAASVAAVAAVVVAALKNIIAPNRSDNKKDVSAPRVNSTLPKENDATLPRVPQTEDAALPRVRRSSRLAQNNTNKRHLQIYSRGTNVNKKI